MTRPANGVVTQMLRAASSGDAQAAASLLPLVYDELRKLARARMAKTPPGNTLQPTALVHEAYLRLIGRDDPGWHGRGHFFAAAAEAMRQILVDQARFKARVKRGGDRKRVEMDGAEPVIQPPAEDLLALDEALTQLERADPHLSKIVALRYFAGLSVEEAAAALGISARTLKRDWQFAKRFLFDALSSPESDAQGVNDNGSGEGQEGQGDIRFRS